MNDLHLGERSQLRCRGTNGIVTENLRLSNILLLVFGNYSTFPLQLQSAESFDQGY